MEKPSNIQVAYDKATAGADLTGGAWGEIAPDGRVTILGTATTTFFDYDLARKAALGNARRLLELRLRALKVSEAIVERVLRLNPDPREGYRLRGFHYKDGRGWGLMTGMIQKGEVLQCHGREVWDRIPRSEWVKKGRRVWVSRWAVEKAAHEPREVLRSPEGVARVWPG